MKKLLMLLLLAFAVAAPRNLQAKDDPGALAPYIEAGKVQGSMDAARQQVLQALGKGGFEILGSYHPANNPDLQVIAFTRKDLKQAVLKVRERGALAAILKVGLVRKGGVVTVSFVNPPYLFNAYLRSETPKQGPVLQKVADELTQALSAVGNEHSGFGGSIAAKKLWNYRYMITMPHFSDPVTLQAYPSFEEGLRTIESNLAKNTVHAKLVYRLVAPEQKTAVFGIALLDREKGEGKFLPVIGEDNIAAMPYEIILQGNTVTMLHGKYRLAMSWPRLSLGRFMKISGTPADIREMLESIAAK